VISRVLGGGGHRAGSGVLGLDEVSPGGVAAIQRGGARPPGAWLALGVWSEPWGRGQSRGRVGRVEGVRRACPSPAHSSAASCRPDPVQISMGAPRPAPPPLHPSPQAVAG
jgi:hypothetical protein